MKLRNKKTGEIVRVEFLSNWQTDDGTEIGFRECNTNIIYSYDSLSKLNEEWEDVEDINVTKMPLIKDEKIRKAVRAWAEANGRDLFKVINEHFNCCKIIGYTDGGHTSCNKIEFSTTIAGADKNYYYTLDELCGEEQ